MSTPIALAVPGLSVEVVGDEVTWTTPERAVRQPLAALWAGGPPDDVEVPPGWFHDANGAPIGGLLEALVTRLDPTLPATDTVWDWRRARTHRLADAAVAAVHAWVAAQGGPVASADRLLAHLRGPPTGGPVPAHDLKRLAAAAAHPDRATLELLARVGEARWLWRDAHRLRVWLGVTRPLAAEVADLLPTTGDAAVASARCLWERCATAGADDAAAVEPVPPHDLPAVRFFLSCAARHLARADGRVLPPVVELPPEGPRPALGGPWAEGSTRTVTLSWTRTTEGTERAGSDRSSPWCRVCGAPDTVLVFLRDDSGTGWRSETCEGRCEACGAYTRVDLDD